MAGKGSGDPVARISPKKIPCVQLQKHYENSSSVVDVCIWRHAELWKIRTHGHCNCICNWILLAPCETDAMLRLQSIETSAEAEI